MLPTAIRRLAATTRPIAPKLRSAMRARVPPPPPPPPRTNDDGSGRFWETKKVWPPDFSKLSARDQFRFERRYKRRLRLATARPRWDRVVRLTQLFSVSFVLVYCVLFMKWDSQIQPFQGVRDKFWGAVGGYAPEPRVEQQSRGIRPSAADQK